MQYVTNPDSVDLNDGFTRVEIIYAPETFQSFPLEAGEEGTIQGYVVNLDSIKMERLTVGQGYNGATVAEFGNSDVFVYDAKAEVFYTKGYNEGDNKYFTKADKPRCVCCL
jgi:hypothetical protein